MVHFGKHIIDPKTGLCEICDRGAIYEIKKGKRQGKQFLYSNQDGKFTYRPNDEELRHNDEATPRFIRKPLYPEPAPSIKLRAPVNDQHHHAPHPATLYHIDSTNQMVHRKIAPSNEPNRHAVQNQHSPPTRPVHVVHRRAHTPPPPHTDSFSSPRRRKNNSDTRIIERQRRVEADHFNHQSPRGVAEMYYIEAPHHSHHNTTLRTNISPSHVNDTSPSKIIYQGDTHRKQRQLEPIQRTHYVEHEPVVSRKVYKKLSPSSFDSRQDEHDPYENNMRPIRKIEKIYPTARQYDSSPQLTNRHVRSPLPYKNPSIYHIQTTN